jgi:hypothetical protein
MRNITADDLIRAVVSRGSSENEALETVRDFVLECRREWSESVLKLFNNDGALSAIKEFLDTALHMHGEVRVLGLGDIKLKYFPQQEWSFLPKDHSVFRSSSHL